MNIPKKSIKIQSSGGCDQVEIISHVQEAHALITFSISKTLPLDWPASAISQISGISVSDSVFHLLEHNVTAWLSGRTAFFLKMSTDPTISIEIHVGPVDDMICSREKPVLSIRWFGHTTSVMHRWVVDYTCIEMAQRSIRDFLASDGCKLPPGSETGT